MPAKRQKSEYDTERIPFISNRDSMRVATEEDIIINGSPIVGKELWFNPPDIPHALVKHVIRDRVTLDSARQYGFKSVNWFPPTWYMGSGGMVEWEDETYVDYLRFYIQDFLILQCSKKRMYVKIDNG